MKRGGFTVQRKARAPGVPTPSSSVRVLLGAWLLGACALLTAPAARAEAPAPAQIVWRLLDYMAVDYRGAVAEGRIQNAAEYAEMQEFAAQVRRRLSDLPEGAARAPLEAQARALEQAIGRKADPAEVAAMARRLAADLLAAYPVPLAPESAPDLVRAAALYTERCASCHGANGDGKGAMASQLDPPPIDFTDAARARERSVFALYQVIAQGLEGTAMASFAGLSTQDRWALAFYVGRFAYPEADRGQEIWSSDARLRERVQDLSDLAGATPASVAAAIGEEEAAAAIAYLRAHPEAVAPRTGPAGSLAIARTKLAASLKAYQARDRQAAIDLALAAYLDGVEPIEPVLAIRAPELVPRLEMALAAFRMAVGRGAPEPEVEAAAAVAEALLTDAEAALSVGTASAASSFLGAFTIFVREGLEALLIVVAMIAFLRKAERRDALRYVHAGWTLALVAGALTWTAATHLIELSGASRELTEGFGSLLAAIILLSVGIWMHGKAQADAWQRYIRERMTAVLSSHWIVFGFAFLVVYREVFETILFYAALWAQGSRGAMLAGAGAGASVLGAIAWAMLRYSRALPISRFFAYSSILIAVLAVVLTGKGVAALQEAGLLGTRPLAGVPRLPLVGLFPTKEGVSSQVLAAAVVALGYGWNGVRARRRDAVIRPR